MPITYRTGALADPQDPRDAPHEIPAGAPGAMPDAHSLVGKIHTIYDQGRTNACVAHAVATALQPRGLDVSRRWLYWCARKLTGHQASDGGTFLRSALKSALKLGCETESGMPWHPQTINSPPSMGSYLRAHSTRIASYARIAPPNLKIAVKTELLAGRPVVFRVLVDDSFAGITTQPWHPGGDVLGMHALCIVGYNPTGAVFVNSWGVHWGDKGKGVIPWQVVENQGLCGDFWSVVP